MTHKIPATDEFVFRFLRDNVYPRLKQKLYGEVLRDAVLSFLVCGENDERAKITALIAIETATRELKRAIDGEDDEEPDSSAPPKCSFCGLRPPEVRLVAGPHAFICDRCVEAFSEVFTADSPRT